MEVTPFENHLSWGSVRLLVHRFSLSPVRECVVLHHSRPTAIDEQRGPSHERGVVTGEKRNHAHNVRGGADPPERVDRLDVFELVFILVAVRT